jgi:hypothetical protein
MAFTTGNVGNMSDLLNAFRSACTANGWTLSGNVLHKSTCFTSVAIASTGDGAQSLAVQGGTGIDGSNALTVAGPSAWRIGSQRPDRPVVFPATYFIHVLTNPDEVYLVLNYNVVEFQWAAFGCSPVPGLPGTGGWYGASVQSSFENANRGSRGASLLGNAGDPYTNRCQPALFWNTGSIGAVCGSVHHGLDGADWGFGDNWYSSPPLPFVDAQSPSLPIIGRMPNAWNGETTLLPIQPILARPSSKVSMLCDLAHARYLRNDNLSDGELITLGSDKWKCYPWLQKNASVRDGSNVDNHSGTLGWAIRYDGP